MRFFAVSALIFATNLPAFALPQASAPASQPASATASAPSRETAAREAMRGFFRAVVAGEEKLAGELIVYTDPAIEKAAEAMFGEAIASQNVRKALGEEFGEAGQKIDIGLSPAEVAKVEKSFDTAKVTLTGDKANIATETGESYVMIFKDGKWKLDFDKTQAAMGPLPPKEIVAGMKKEADAHARLAVEIKAKKYKTVDEVEAQLQKISRDTESSFQAGGGPENPMDALPPAGVSPPPAPPPKQP